MQTPGLGSALLWVFLHPKGHGRSWVRLHHACDSAVYGATVKSHICVTKVFSPLLGLFFFFF